MKISAINSVKYKSIQNKNDQTSSQSTTSQVINQNKNIKMLPANNMAYLVGFKGVSETSNIDFVKKPNGTRIISFRNNDDSSLSQIAMSLIDINSKRFSGFCNRDCIFNIEEHYDTFFKGYKGEIDGEILKLKTNKYFNNFTGKLGSKSVEIHKNRVYRKGEFEEVDMHDTQISGSVGEEYFRIQTINHPEGKEVKGFISSTYDPNEVPDEDRFSFISSPDDVSGLIRSKSNLFPLIYAIADFQSNPYYGDPDSYKQALNYKTPPATDYYSSDDDMVVGSDYKYWDGPYAP